MKLKLSAVLAVVFSVAFAAAQEEQTAVPEVQPLKTKKEKVSYAIGVDAAKNFHSRGLDLDPELLTKGFKDVYSGSELLLSDEEIRAVLVGLQKEVAQKRDEAIKALAEKNKKEGEAFLTENKVREGIVTLASGLQYKILKAGEGKKPTLEDTVEAHYRGTFLDGKEFDSSFRRGKPAAFAVKRVIAGWKEALPLMSEGSKWQLFIPSELAYGTRGNGDVGPNSVLIFEVELLSVKPAEKAKE